MNIKAIILITVSTLMILTSGCVHMTSLSADGLYAEYRNHELKADSKYKDKTLFVSGTISSMGRNNAGQAYIVLRTGFTSYNQYTLQQQYVGIECQFNEGRESELADIDVRDWVYIRGKCRGFGNQSQGIVIGVLDPHGNVILEDCAYRAASHNWWKFNLAISYTLLSSQSIPLSNQCFL